MELAKRLGFALVFFALVGTLPACAGSPGPEPENEGVSLNTPNTQEASRPPAEGEEDAAQWWKKSMSAPEVRAEPNEDAAQWWTDPATASETTTAGDPDTPADDEGVNPATVVSSGEDEEAESLTVVSLEDEGETDGNVDTPNDEEVNPATVASSGDEGETDGNASVSTAITPEMDTSSPEGVMEPAAASSEHERGTDESVGTPEVEVFSTSELSPLFEVPGLMPGLHGIVKVNPAPGGHQARARLIQCSLLAGGILEEVPEGELLSPHDSLEENHVAVRYAKRSAYERRVKVQENECPAQFFLLMTEDLINGLRTLGDVLRAGTGDEHPDLSILPLQADMRIWSQVPGKRPMILNRGYRVAGKYGDILQKEEKLAGFAQFLPFVYELRGEGFLAAR